MGRVVTAFHYGLMVLRGVLWAGIWRAGDISGQHLKLSSIQTIFLFKITFHDIFFIFIFYAFTYMYACLFHNNLYLNLLYYIIIIIHIILYSKIKYSKAAACLLPAHTTTSLPALPPSSCLYMYAISCMLSACLPVPPSCLP